MSSAADLIGQTLGGYKLVKPIGAGAMATVFKAHQPNLERWVAVKVLHYKDRQALLRFQREAKAIALLRHRNILIVYEYGEEGSWPYLVMEYVPGGSLSEQLAGRPMDWERAVRLVIPVAEALAYAHGQGIIHRDVKPSNILLPQPDWPLLADFGLVKVINAAEAVTRPGASLGTPAYVAPEQARGVATDHRADMYSLGVILFELVTGRLPFNYSNPTKLLLAHISEQAPSVRALNPACPAALEQVIQTAMQKLPAGRYHDMGELIVALGDLLAEGGQLTPTPRPRLEARVLIADQNAAITVPDQDSAIIGRTHRDTIAEIDLGPYGAARLGVSRQHARLIRRGSEWLIDDLGSVNGTFVNDVEIKAGQPAPLKNGDVIRCSHMSVIFLVSGAG